MVQDGDTFHGLGFPSSPCFRRTSGGGSAPRREYGDLLSSQFDGSLVRLEWNKSITQSMFCTYNFLSNNPILTRHPLT